jgi:hypothetical protein
VTGRRSDDAGGDYLGAAKTALDLLKGARDLLPKGKESDEAGKKIAEAERALTNSEADLARKLGSPSLPMYLAATDHAVGQGPLAADSWTQGALL